MDAFIWGQNGQQLSSDQQRLQIAQALLQQSQQPATSWTQGAANMLNAFSGNAYLRQVQNNTAYNPFAGSGTDASNPSVATSGLGSALLSPASALRGLFQSNPFSGGGTAADNW